MGWSYVFNIILKLRLTENVAIIQPNHEDQWTTLIDCD